MVRIERVGDITRLRLSTRRSRALGYEVSAFVVDGVLIDCGFPAVDRDVGLLLDQLRPRGVLLTHAHEDHAGNAGLVVQRGIPLVASRETLGILRDGQRLGLYQRVCWGSPSRLTLRPMGFEHPGLEMIATPGHSPDHQIVWNAERETVFAGDLFLGVKVRAARPAEEPRMLARSVRAVAALRPRMMLDAHRGMVEDPVGVLTAKADWIEETVGRIDTLLDAGWTERAVTRAVLGREDLLTAVTSGDLSRLNFVRAVARSRPVSLSVPIPSPG